MLDNENVMGRSFNDWDMLGYPLSGFVISTEKVHPERIITCQFAVYLEEQYKMTPKSKRESFFTLKEDGIHVKPAGWKVAGDNLKKVLHNINDKYDWDIQFLYDKKLREEPIPFFYVHVRPNIVDPDKVTYDELLKVSNIAAMAHSYLSDGSRGSFFN